MKCFRLTFICIICVLGLQLHAQEFPVITYPFQTIEWENNSTITPVADMCLDEAGYLYIATKEGVFIWDGNRMRNIAHDPDDSTSLISNDVNAIISAGKNKIAIITNSGLAILDTKTNTLYQTNSKDLSANGFNGIKYVEIDNKNQLWLANEKNIVVYNTDTKVYTPFKLLDGKLINNEYIIDVFADKNEIYFLTTYHLYVYSILNNTLQLVQLPLENEEMVSFTITTTKILILNTGGNLYQFNKKSLALIQSNFLSDFISPYGSYPIVEVSEDEFWITSSLNKLNYIISGNTVNQLQLSGITDNIYAKTILKSPSGDLYFGCSNNVKYIPAKLIQSQTIPFTRRQKAMERRMPKNIVVKDSTIFSIDRNWFFYEHHLPTDKITANNKLPDLIIKLYMPAVYIYPINDTAYLTGYANNDFPQSNLNKTSIINNKLSYFFYYNTKKQQYSSADFNTTFYNPAKGKYQYDAFNTNDSTIYFIKNNHIEWHHFTNKTTKTIHFSVDTALYSQLFYAIYLDADGNFWTASVHDASNPKKTKSGCLVKYHYPSGKTTVYPAGKGISFASSIVLDITCDAKGNVYLLNKFGVCQLNPGSGKTSVYYSNELLPDNTYVSMELDAKNRLWLGTLTNGIVVYDIPTNKFILLKGQPTLLSNDMLMQASTQDDNNHLYFWDVTGINIFNANDIQFNLPQPKAIVSDILMRGKSIIGNKLIDDLATYVFPHNNNDIDFAFSLLSFNESSKNTFAYMLEGVDEKWIYADTRNFASYHNLSPGKYTFLVKGKNNYGIWSEQPTKVIIEITPAFWQTVWFKLLCTLLVTAIIYWIYKLRLERALAVEKMRTKISRDLHDDLGSTLSSISILSGQVKSRLIKQPETVEPILDKINESAIKMNDSLQDLVWAVKPENDTLQELLVRMEQFASGILESKNINYTFTGPTTVSDIKLNPELIRNIYLIFKEAVNNAAKYSNCANVTITIKEKGKQLSLSVIDDGIGFNPETVKRGNGLNNMTKRAAQIGGSLNIISEPNKQSGIVLECKITS